MKHIAIATLIILGILPLAYFVTVQYGIAQDMSETDLVPQGPLSRYVENIAFGVGEQLVFEIGYGFITAGTATLEVAELVEFEDRPAYRIVSTAESNKFVSSFYPVKDRVESIVDALGIFSWHFDKNLREGNYRSHRVYSFDQVNHTVVYEDSVHEIAPYVQDALSIMYFVRTQPLKVGTSVFVDSFVDGRHYPLEVKVLEKERIKTKAGEFDCLVVEPVMKAAGIFKHEGKLKVWLTDDRVKMPVLMKSRVLVGSINAELIDYSLGQLEEF